MTESIEARGGAPADGSQSGRQQGSDLASDESPQSVEQPNRIDLNETAALPPKESAGTTVDLQVLGLPSVTHLLHELDDDTETMASVGDDKLQQAEQSQRSAVGPDKEAPVSPADVEGGAHDSVEEASTAYLLSRGTEFQTGHRAHPEVSLDAWEDGAFRLHRRSPTEFAGAERREYRPDSPATLAQSIAPDDASDEEEEDSAAQALPPGVGPFRNRPRQGVTRRELIGRNGPDPCDYHVRHLEIEPGGHTLHQRGENVTTLIIECGAGYVRLHEHWHLVQPGEVIYVGRQTPYQLACPQVATRPMGVLVIMDARRGTITPILEI